jgi:hypothetical protein
MTTWDKQVYNKLYRQFKAQLLRSGRRQSKDIRKSATLPLSSCSSEHLASALWRLFDLATLA